MTNFLLFLVVSIQRYTCIKVTLSQTDPTHPLQLDHLLSLAWAIYCVRSGVPLLLWTLVTEKYKYYCFEDAIIVFISKSPVFYTITVGVQGCCCMLSRTIIHSLMVRLPWMSNRPSQRLLTATTHTNYK